MGHFILFWDMLFFRHIYFSLEHFILPSDMLFFLWTLYSSLEHFILPHENNKGSQVRIKCPRFKNKVSQV